MPLTEVLNCNEFIQKLRVLMIDPEFECIIFYDIAGSIGMKVHENGEKRLYFAEDEVGVYPSEFLWFMDSLRDMYEIIRKRRNDASSERRRVRQETQESR